MPPITQTKIKPIIKAVLISRPFKIAAGVLLAYLLFAYLAVNPLAKRLLPWVAENKLASRMTVEQVQFDPWRLILRVDQLRLTRPDGAPLAGFERLQVNLDTTGIFRFAWRLQDIRLTGPQVVFDIGPDGKLNWAELIAKLNEEPEEPSSGMTRLLIDHILIENGHIQYNEHNRPTPFRMALKPLGLELDGLSTLPEDRGDYLIAAKLPEQGGTLKWKGDIALNPVASKGSLELQGVNLAKLLQVVDPASMPVKLSSGDLQTRFGYDFAMVEQTVAQNTAAKDGAEAVSTRVPQARLSDIAIKLSYLAATLDPQTSLSLDEAALKLPVLDFSMQKGAQVQFHDLAFTARQLTWRDTGFVQPLRAEVKEIGLGFSLDNHDGAFAIHQAKAELSDASLYSGDTAQAVASLAKAIASDGEISLKDSTVQLASLMLSGLATEVTRSADGKLNWQQILESKAVSNDTGPPATADAQPSPWRLALAQLALENSSVHYSDSSTPSPVTLDVQQIALELQQATLDLAKPVPLKAKLQIKQGGQLNVSGQLVPNPLKADLQLNLQGLSLKPFTPYVNQAAYLKLEDGRANLKGKLALRSAKTLQGNFTGAFSVERLQINEEQGGATFLAWKEVASESLKFDLGQPRLHMDALRIVEPVGKFIIYEDRTLNVKRILRPVAPATGQAATQNMQPASQESSFAVSVDRISIDNASLEFADLSLKPQFGTNIHSLGGVINGLSSSTSSTAQVELDGKVDEFGSARIRGSVQPFRATDFTDLKLAFHNLEMTRLTPYSGKFAGRRIDSGKLSVDLEYKIKQRQLAGDNKFVINKLKLGERVESPDAANLPLDLAIALLEDKDGLIDLDLPVTGNLDDPQFNYGKIVWKAIVNVIGKIVTSPFRALGKLLGVSGDKLDAIVFEPGKASLAPEEQEKLKAIASALEKRPALVMRVSPTIDPAADLAALQEQVTRRDVLNEMGIKLKEGEQPGPIDLNNPKAQVAIESMLKERQGKGGSLKAVNRLKAYFKKADPEATPKYAEMLEQLALTANVAESDLQALGKARAEGLQGYMKESAGLGADRVTLGEPGKVESDGKHIAIKMELGVGPSASQSPAP